MIYLISVFSRPSRPSRHPRLSALSAALPAMASLAAALLLAAAAPSPLLAQNTTQPDALFRSHPPLSAGEVAQEIEFLRRLKSPSSREDADAALESFAHERGLSRERLMYVHAKCAVGARILSGMEITDEELASAFGSVHARPTPAEQALIEARRDEIVSGFAAD
ncbi:MAG: hypothetical protein LBQ12_15790 [Deltaproteobacteria bacterium]|jgi:hypothetical protein|nr:hypothetical protein [Deltaproteobacteria bacterium]